MRTSIRGAKLLCSLLVGLPLMSCSTSSPAAPSRQASGSALTPPNVVVLGDSLAISPSRADNFTTALQERLDDSGFAWKIVNAGVGGAVTADGVQRLDSLLTIDSRILVLELGANDGLRGISTETVEQNLATIIERSQARGIRVLLCGMETPPTHGLEYSLAFHRVFPSVAIRYGVTLVPFLLAGVVLNSSRNGPDLFHPNTAGARQIADTVWPYLERLIEKTSASDAVS